MEMAGCFLVCFRFFCFWFFVGSKAKFIELPKREETREGCPEMASFMLLYFTTIQTERDQETGRKEGH